GEIDRVERLPRLVVVRPDRIGDAPAGDGEIRIEFKCVLEAPDRLVMVERIRPDKAAVSPDLRLRRRRVDLAVIRAQVVVPVDVAARNAHRRHDNSPATPWRGRRAGSRPRPRSPTSAAASP